MLWPMSRASRPRTARVADVTADCHLPPTHPHIHTILTAITSPDAFIYFSSRRESPKHRLPWGLRPVWVSTERKAHLTRLLTWYYTAQCSSRDEGGSWFGVCFNSNVDEDGGGKVTYHLPVIHFLHKCIRGISMYWFHVLLLILWSHLIFYKVCSILLFHMFVFVLEGRVCVYITLISRQEYCHSNCMVLVDVTFSSLKLLKLNKI